MDSLTSKTIGIVGGAGPMAGLLLARKVIETCQTEYSCTKDADFPKLVFLSIPFAEMLQPNTEHQEERVVRKQLRESAQFLIGAGVSRFAIACNTLHCFLDELFTDRLVGLISETEQFIRDQEYRNVLVLATCTSNLKRLYRFEGATYPDCEKQKEVDGVRNCWMKSIYI